MVGTQSTRQRPTTAQAPAKAAMAAKPALALVRRARKTNRALADAYPDAHCELDFTTPLELLVATVLSAQCTDKRVNQVTPALFARFPDAQAYAEADPGEIEDLIRSTGFFRAKARSLSGIGVALVANYGGEVPGALDDLVTLPGVGRKTANVVLGNAFGIPGITVDTHVGRLVRRWGWTTSQDPVVVEHEIGTLIERREWTLFSHRAIFHGRRVCFARKPACGACPVAALCPSVGIGEMDLETAKAMVRSR